MKLKLVFFTALLALAGTAFAAPIPIGATTSSPESSAYPHSPAQGHMGPCEKDQSKCEADAAKFDQWCSANAQKCMNLKSWAEKRIEACDKDPQKCKEREEKMRQEHEAMCQQDPSKPHCHAIKANNQPNDQDQNGDQGDQAPPPPGL